MLFTMSKTFWCSNWLIYCWLTCFISFQKVLLIFCEVSSRWVRPPFKIKPVFKCICHKQHKVGMLMIEHLLPGVPSVAVIPGHCGLLLPIRLEDNPKAEVASPSAVEGPSLSLIIFLRVPLSFPGLGSLGRALGPPPPPLYQTCGWRGKTGARGEERWKELLGTFSPKSSLCLHRHWVKRLHLKHVTYKIWFMQCASRR